MVILQEDRRTFCILCEKGWNLPVKIQNHDNFQVFLRHYIFTGIQSNAFSLIPFLVKKGSYTYFWSDNFVILFINLPLFILFLNFLLFPGVYFFSSMFFWETLILDQPLQPECICSESCVRILPGLLGMPDWFVLLVFSRAVGYYKKWFWDTISSWNP